MRTVATIVLVAVWLSACTMASTSQDDGYLVSQFTGLWVRVNGPYEGYKATAEGKQLVMSPMRDTECLKANDRAYIGEIVGDQILGKAYICIDGSHRAVSDMIISILDTNTLSARITQSPQTHEILFERDFYLTQ